MLSNNLPRRQSKVENRKVCQRPYQQEMGQQEIDDLLASDEENSPKATKETTKAPKSDSASSDGKVSSKDASGENGLSNGHSNGSDEKSGLATNSIFSVSFLLKIFDLPGGQINDPQSGKHYSL